MKTCTKCKEEKSLHDFYFDNYHGRYQSQCKECRKKLVIAAQKLPENKPRLRKAQLKHKYGITPEQYDGMLYAQGGHCAMCPATEPGGGRIFFSVDHDHACCPTAAKSCGKCVRGLLCLRCNNSLGWYETHKEAVELYLTAR